jgi:hypothetical protein
MINASAMSRDVQRSSAMIVDLLAFSASHQVVGLIPWLRKTAVPARFTQMTFTIKSISALEASRILPDPSISPNVTRGGSNDTDIATPMRVPDAREVSARAPTAPDARARIMSTRFTLSREAISLLLGSTEKMYPRAVDNPTTTARPAKLALRAFFARSLSAA